MTTFQDPPPQSRRSARQSERGEQAETASFSDFQVPPQQQPTVVEPPVAPSSGRRARAAEPLEAPAEPLNYTTQGRDPASYETQLPAAGYAPAPQEPAAFRVRDYSPEGGGRRAATPPPLIEPQQPVYGAGASDLDYRTQAGPVAPEPVEQQTFSRRELRERQAAADAAAGIVPEALIAPQEPALLTQPPQLLTQPPAPQLFTAPPPTAPAIQTAPPPVGPPSTLTTPPSTVNAPPASTITAPPAATVTTPPPSIFDAPPPAATVTTPPPAATVTTPPPSIFDAPPPAIVTAQPTALSNAKTEFEALTRNGQPPAPNASERVADPVTPTFIEPELEPELEHTGGWIAPVGHWSRQADLDDETQPWENTITREVGGGNVATTTSALVLPEIPRATSFPVALDSTGEVLLTGSIDLPQSLSAGNGDPRRYDDSNVDLMFDTQDAELSGTDSSPVRAISAVSTHTSSRGVIHANKPHGNRLIVAVFIATAVLAVGVVGMLVASLFMNLF